MAHYPDWLHLLAWAYIGMCLACTLGLAICPVLRPQKMWIISLVWPITGLYMGLCAVLLYRRSRPVLVEKPQTLQMKAAVDRTRDKPPTLFQLSIAVFHC